jgi:glycosyltransferase involved in cell wall biosynthesis
MLLVLSSLWGATGGIPSFNRLLVRAAADYAAARRRQLKVIALTDAPGAAVPASWLAQLPDGMWTPASYVPCAGARGRCVAAVLAERPRQQLVVLGHVNLGPLGLLWPRHGVIAHGTEVWRPLPWLRRRALVRAAAVGCVSDHTAAAVVREQGVDAGCCVRLINALPALPEAVAGPVGQGGPVRVLSVTRLHPGEPKGIDLVLAALPSLPEVEYTVVGTGAALPGLQRLAAALGVAARVRFLGEVSDRERDAELQRCDVFALPSSGEGFGIVYLEAMAWSKPCLAAAAGGAPEVVRAGETGLVVAPAAEPVRAALQQLVSSAALRSQLGRAGRERVAQHFGYAPFRAHAARFFSRLEPPRPA